MSIEDIEKSLFVLIVKMKNEYCYKEGESNADTLNQCVQQIVHTVTQHNVKEYRERLIDKIQTEDRLDSNLSIEEIEQIINEVLKDE